MSRELPSRPHLDHLKKQARRRLAGLQRENPAAQLADALHATARDYGFSTWPQLKAHVEAVDPPASNPFAGRWTANVAKSQRHPLNEFQQATLEFEIGGDVVTISHIAVDASGREQRDTNTVVADGQPHLLTHGNGYVARWTGSRVLDVEARKYERVVGRGTYEVSTDGRVMVVSTAEQRIVLERSKPAP